MFWINIKIQAGTANQLKAAVSIGSVVRLPAAHDPRYGFGHEILARHFKIVVRLEIQLELRAVTKYKPKRSAVSAVIRRRLFTV